jgi:hypothetical protein
VTIVTDLEEASQCDGQPVRLPGGDTMSLNQTVAYQSHGSRRFRWIAPMLVTLGLVVASVAPGLMLG